MVLLRVLIVDENYPVYNHKKNVTYNKLVHITEVSFIIIDLKNMKSIHGLKVKEMNFDCAINLNRALLMLEHCN
jgi:hypothetical protein